MNDGIRPLIAGNWKMNGIKASMAEFDAMLAGAGAFAGKADLLVCPPATLISSFAEKARGKGVAEWSNGSSVPWPSRPTTSTRQV